MYSVFEKLPDEKKKRIIDACIKEFGANGYTNTSTNNIIKEANISKGLLFHYFGNKKNLYLYIVEYTTNHYVNLLLESMKVLDSDFFQRVMDFAELKMKISAEEPLVYNFFASVYISDLPEEIKPEVNEIYSKLVEISNEYSFKDIDMSKFRDDIDKEKTIEIILLALYGISDKYAKIYKSREDKGFAIRQQASEEMKEYIEILKKGFYKWNRKLESFTSH